MLKNTGLNYWLLTSEYPPFSGGGISTYCFHSAQMLTSNGNQVTVFVNDKSVKSFTVENHAEARIIRFNPTSTNTWSFLGSTTRLSYEFSEIVKRFIEKEGKPDIIESQDYLGIGYFLLQFKHCLYDWCKDIPIVITIHSPAFLYMEYNEVPSYKMPNYWIGEMERFSIQAADLLIAPSRYIVDQLNERFKITNQNIHVIPNPYQSNAISPTYNNKLLNNDIAFYGKLSPQKGTFKILGEFKKLWGKGFKEKFIMIGGQDIVYHPVGKTMGSVIQQQYSEYIKKGLLKLEKPVILSSLLKNLPDQLVYMVPSIVDNLPYVVLELMNEGKIVVVSKQGGQSEIIKNGSDGFVFDYADSDSFSAILHKVLDLSKEERNLISQEAQKKIKTNYSYEKVYPLKISLVNKLLIKDTTPSEKFPFIREPGQEVINQTYHQGLKLSVIIPYYNLGRYIDESIDSVLQSSYKDIEVLIINDGSTDPESINKIKKYRNHPIVNVLDKKNTGLADTRNFGAKAAVGDFIAFLDADDAVEKTYYEKAIKILSHYKNVHFAGCWTRYFQGSTNIWPTFNPEPPLILIHNTINSSALVYKKESFLKGGLNDIDFSIGLEDYESVISMVSKGLNGIALPEVLFRYRVRKKSMIKKSTWEVRSDYYEKMSKKHKDFYIKYRTEIQDLIRFNGAPLMYDNSTLDAIPFSGFPFIRNIYPKIFSLIQSNPRLKRLILKILRFQINKV